MVPKNLFKIFSFLFLFFIPFAVSGAATITCGTNNICTQNQACTCAASCTGFLLSLYSSQTSINFDWENYTSTNSLAIPTSQLSTASTKYVKALCDSGEETIRQPITINAGSTGEQCGNGVCSSTETCSSCSADCGTCPTSGGRTPRSSSLCGDLRCDSGEETTCCVDCGCPPDMRCINNICAPPEEQAEVCGNNYVAGGEACDGTANENCPGFCTASCTCPFIVNDGICDSAVGETYEISADCPGPTCGNNQVDAGEQCDGTTDSACPGICKASCQCYIVGDGLCEKAAGENKENSPKDCKVKFTFFGWPIVLICSLIIAAIAAAAIYLRRRGEQGPPEVVDRETAIRAAAQEKLSAYVRDALSKGYAPEQLRGALIKSGWKQEYVDEALNQQP